MRNIRVLKWAVQAVKNYIYQHDWESIDKYHQRCAEIGLEAIATIGKPQAVMLTFWPGSEYKDTSPSEIIEELKRHFREHDKVNSCHDIVVQWVMEFREPTPGVNGESGIPGGWHYHAMVAIDFSKVSVKYLIKVVNQMQQDGYFHLYWLSRVGGSRDKAAPIQFHDLLTQEGWAEYLKHSEYPAKARSKVRAKGKRNMGGSQVTRMSEWFQKLLPGGELVPA